MVETQHFLHDFHTAAAIFTLVKRAWRPQLAADFEQADVAALKLKTGALNRSAIPPQIQ
jgi:hypothetical protein